jgi:hypothetical protein
MPIEITLLTSKSGLLTKTIRRTADGKLDSTSANLMSFGSACRLDISRMGELAELLNSGLRRDQAISNGVIRADKPDKVTVTSVKATETLEQMGDGQNCIARSKLYLEYRAQATLFNGDTDLAQAPARVTEQFAAGCRPWDVFVAICPGLQGTGHVMRRSTSSGIIDRETGHAFADSGGWHTFFPITDGTDMKGFSRWLHDGCALVGMHWCFITACGTVLRRSIIDLAVASPERIIFEAAPIVEPPLWQDPEWRRAAFVDGPAFDSRSRHIRSAAENEAISAAWAVEEARVAPHAAAVRADWIEAKAAEMSTRSGRDMAYCRLAAERWTQHDLLPEVQLEFRDFGFVTVAEVWENPMRYLDRELADPIEGAAYKSGLSCCKLYIDRNGTPWVKSFAHGGARYNLCLEDSWQGDARKLGAAHGANQSFGPLPVVDGGSVWSPPVPIGNRRAAQHDGPAGVRRPKDTRSSTICRLAFQMIRNGAADDRIKSALQAENKTLSPPLPSDRVDELIAWARSEKASTNV